MERIAIDMDEVMADTVASQVVWYGRYGYKWEPGALQGRRFEDLVSADHFEAHEQVLHEGSFFGDLPVMAGAQEVVRALWDRYEIFVTSAAMEYPMSCGAKFRWLKQHFNFIPPKNIVFCGDKSILRADYLIDDNAKHFERFAGKGVLFSAPHNAAEMRYERLANWAEAKRRFLP